MKTALRIIIAMFILTAAMSIALAEPAGPRFITSISNETLPIKDSVMVNAIAGNVTEMNINAWSVTRTWQGYYGNVTGTIVLADQDNNTLYDWSNTNPRGRIYATRTSSTPNWLSTRCANQTELNVNEAQFAGVNETDRNGNYPIDRINNTFVNSTDNLRSDGVSSWNIRYANYSRFWVGPVQINGTGEVGECFSTVMNNATGWVEGNPTAANDVNRWREVLLSDGTDRIYTSIIEQNYAQGFDGETRDFQMIVPEDGHGTDTAVTPYYFYVDLE